MPKELAINTLTDIVGGGLDTPFSVQSGDTVRAITSPGCWGPMITPGIKSGHEVSSPVRVEGAIPGDAVAVTVERICVLSEFAASGVGMRCPQNFGKDPTIHAICPYCNVEYPQTHLEGTGDDAVRCRGCGNPIIPQTMKHGYTTVYSQEDNLAVTVPGPLAEEIARRTQEGEVYLPEDSKQHPATILAKSDLQNLLIRARPMVGNIGCIPAKAIPSAKNSGDLIASLNATGLYETVGPEDITDAHMDINSAVEGCIVLSPVLVEGAGVYLGDVHLTQGNGELAGHTLDISAETTFQVELLQGLRLEGPILLPPPGEYDGRFRPFTRKEYAAAQDTLSRYGASLEERRYPIQVVGSGAGLNAAIDSAVARAARYTGLAREEICNLATVGGEVEIGRTTGTAYLTLMLTEAVLQQMGIFHLVKRQYG